MKLQATLLSLTLACFLTSFTAQAQGERQNNDSRPDGMMKRAKKSNEDSGIPSMGEVVERAESNGQFEARSKKKDCKESKHRDRKDGRGDQSGHKSHQNHLDHHHHNGVNATHHHAHPRKTHKTHEKSSHQGTSSSHTKSDINSRVYQGKCPHPNASKNSPNGDIHFLNCNIDSAWQPPNVKMDDLSIVSAETVVTGDVFKPCAKYLTEFKQIAAEYHVHPTLLMAFAMQESHCDAGLTGPNGEIGIMQIIPASCRGDCWSVKNNIRLGAKEFSKTLRSNGGNVLEAIGQYNGWEKGLAVWKVRKEQYGCYAQQNLDYLYQMLNGWLQGKDGYAKEFCIYDNLAHCK
ncbi:hypothetical protein CBS101457_002775 [Exobasidium rhododendri]|nr:hypothetical protein CBS101457_002775 [Exobasidium rhododendri]